MNIFALDLDPTKIPELLIDNYVNRLLSEGTICFMNAVYYNFYNVARASVDPITLEEFRESITYGIYPAAKNTWFVTQNNTRSKLSWLYLYLLELHKEYKYRFDKEHKCGIIIENFNKDLVCIHKHRAYMIMDVSINNKHPQEFIRENPVESYRAYYRYKVKMLLEKSKTNKAVQRIQFTRREIPEMLKDIFLECGG